MSDDARRRLPIFPLDVVLFPETLLPLHIFEPRYRAMVADALQGDKTIGIQRLKEGEPPDGEGRPAIFDIGCAGEIVEHEPIEDGRSNIVLKGLYRYRVDREPPSPHLYRVADVTKLPVAPLPEASGSGSLSRREFRRLLSTLVSKLADSVGRPEAGELPSELNDEGLVNEALSRLGLDTDDRYRLLSMDQLEERYGWVVAHVSAAQKRLDFLKPYRRSGADTRNN